MHLVVITLMAFSSADSLYQSYLNFSRGFQFEQEGNYIKALDLYQRTKEYEPENLEIDYYIARTKFLSGDFQGAKNIVEDLINKREDYRFYQLLGDCYLKLIKIDKALENYKIALKLNENDILIYHIANLMETIGQLKEALEYYQMLEKTGADPDIRMRIASLLGRIGKPRDVVEYLNKFPSHNHPDYYLNLGIAYDQLGIVDSAIIKYQAVLEVDSTNLTVMKRLLDLYLQVDSLEKASAIGNIALKIAPIDPGLNRSLGYLSYRENQLDLALMHFVIVLGTKPDDLYSNYYVGRIYLDKRLYNSALKYLRRAVEIDPDFSDALVNLGLVEMETHDYKKARQLFQRAIKNNFDPGEGIYLIGLSKAMEGDLEGSYLDLKAALKMRPDDLKILSTLGNISDDLGRVGEAFEYYKRIVNIDSTNALALNYVGYTFAEKGDSLEYALTLIQRALKIDSTNAYYIDSLGWVYFQMGDYDQALKELIRASEITEDAVILEHLGDVYIKFSEHKKAERAYQRALKFDPGNKKLKEKIKSLNSNY